MAQTVLVTGISRYLGSRVAAALAADPSVERVIGVDTVAPGRADLDRLGRTEFVRADIRNPLIARVISSAAVDTVVHASVTATPHGAGGRAPMKEMNVLGTMQLLAACQKSESVRRLVLKSTTAVYGSSPRDPAVFSEDTPARALPRSGYGKDAVEVEGYVRGFSRRRPDVDVTVLRFGNFIGPTIDSALVRYFTLPVVPTALGHDPRLQFVHETDAVEVLRLAAVGAHPGVFNVAGTGAMLLSQAVRRAGRIALPVPGPAVDVVSRWVRRAGLVDYSPEQLGLLSYGRVVDVSRLQRAFGFSPRFTSEQAFDAFLRDRPITPVIDPRRVESVTGAIGGLLGLSPAALATSLRATPARAAAAATTARRGFGMAEARVIPMYSEPSRPQPSAVDADPPTSTRSSVDRVAAQTLAFLRRRITGDYEVDEFGFDADLAANVAIPLLRPLAERWFRIDTQGVDHVPAAGGALLVGNHAGGLWALDAAMTSVALYDAHPEKRMLRLLAADLVLRTPFLGSVARKTGTTLACNPDAERLLNAGELVGVWPEGFKGIGKPFSERYKLQRFGRGGFVSAALRTGVPIVPVSIVGSEEIHPVLGNAGLLARLLNLPYFPLTPTFPWLGPLGVIPLPSKWIIEFGEPIVTSGYGPDAAEDPMLVFELTDRVRETIQSTLYRLLLQRRSVWR